MEQVSNDSGARGSAELWLQAAYDTLLESGIDGVRILPLAKKLGLSRTSFYWFFDDREALLAALLSRWKDKNTGNLVGRTEAYAESVVEAMLNVNDCWFDASLFDSRLEFAIRSWALQSQAIEAEVASADEQRLDALCRMLVRFGVEPGMADVRARTVYLVQIGYITMQVKEDLKTRMRRVPHYVEIFTGRAPWQSELDRFFARHGYRPGSTA